MLVLFRRAIDAFYKPPKLYIAYDYRTRKKHAGPPIVFLHGIASSSADFNALKEKLPTDRRILYLDLLGHGKSPSPKTGYTIDAMSRSLDKTLRSLKIDKPVLVGYSMGAMVAIRYASRYRNASYVVSASMPLYTYESTSSILHRMTAKLYETLQTQQNFTLGLAKVVATIQANRSGLHLTEENWTAFYESMRNIVIGYNPAVDAVRIDHLKMIVGQLDPFVSVDATYEFADAVKAEGVVQANSGFHMMNSSYDNAIVEALQATSYKV